MLNGEILDYEQPINYDKYGRMIYHPDYHENHKQPYTESDKEYLCKYWEVDHRQSLSFALGKPEHSLATKVWQLKKERKFDYYKNLNKYW